MQFSKIFICGGFVHEADSQSMHVILVEHAGVRSPNNNDHLYGLIRGCKVKKCLTLCPALHRAEHIDFAALRLFKYILPAFKAYPLKLNTQHLFDQTDIIGA